MVLAWLFRSISKSTPLRGVGRIYVRVFLKVMFFVYLISKKTFIDYDKVLSSFLIISLSSKCFGMNWKHISLFPLILVQFHALAAPPHLSSTTAIKMMQLLPHIDHAFSLVIQQECKMLSPSSKDISILYTTIPVSALQVNSNSSNGGNKSWNPNFKRKIIYVKPNRVCTHCGHTNHTTKTYFVKHGYPPRFKNKPKLNSSGNNVFDQSLTPSASSSFGFT